MVNMLKCSICGKYFPIILIKSVFYYNTKVKVKIKVYQHTNVQQKLTTKYFCKKSHKSEYLSNILEKNIRKSKSKNLVKQIFEKVMLKT